MNETNSSGIKFKSIDLLSSCVEVRNQSVDNLSYKLGVTSIKRNVINEEELRVVVSFDLMKGIEEPPFTFAATYSACYIRSPDAKMTWDEFDNGYILTHILPYFRELASSITLRLPFPALIIPPTNIKALLANYTKSVDTE
jgi:preprotein translocase subunit SecB